MSIPKEAKTVQEIQAYYSIETKHRPNSIKKLMSEKWFPEACIQKFEADNQKLKEKVKIQAELFNNSSKFVKELQDENGNLTEELATAKELIDEKCDFIAIQNQKIEDSNQVIHDLNVNCKYKKRIGEAQQLLKEYPHYVSFVPTPAIKEWVGKLRAILAPSETTDYGFDKLPASLLHTSKAEKETKT
ncbi:hypothetical protein MUP77_08695 [Candidatus Bathyarchaeota archaeon]|nr:hypothetical protein [Candidatus Bathyarchaeota archaeon]